MVGKGRLLMGAGIEGDLRVTKSSMCRPASDTV